MKIDPKILAVLSAAKCSGPHLTLPEMLSRKDYTKANQAIMAAGGVWSRTAKAHVFMVEASDAMDRILLTGEITQEKQEFGVFYTPKHVAGKVIRLAEIKPNMRVLEPSAGSGALAMEAIAAGGDVYCCEVRTGTGCALEGTDRWETVDFLAVDAALAGHFDRVVMNPPFAKQADIAHVVHAMTFLKPGGRLVAVMSAGVTFRQDLKTRLFRTLIESNAGRIIPLPEGAFKEAGTLVKTVIVIMEK